MDRMKSARRYFCQNIKQTKMNIKKLSFRWLFLQSIKNDDIKMTKSLLLKKKTNKSIFNQ